jgi:hypothetical protein
MPKPCSASAATPRPGYDVVVKTDAASPFAPDALYGSGWAQQELGQTEAAVNAFTDLVQAWPEHSTPWSGPGAWRSPASRRDPA